VLILALASMVILPWINFIEIRKLKNIIYQLTSPLSESEVANKTMSESIYSQDSLQENELLPRIKEEKEELAKKINQKIINKDIKPKTINFEQKFLTRLTVWIGGFALALAGLFLVKYSIENSILSPVARVILSSIFAIALIYCAEIIHKKPNFANGTRIAQSLAGAGIAIFYAISFASAHLYKIIPEFGGFIAMAAVTLSSLILSLRYGPPMALLGMVVGFLSPFLFDDAKKDVAALFIYLYLMTSGILFVVRKNNWWWLAIPAILMSMFWVFIWMIFSQNPADGIYVILFLLAISSTMFFISKKQYQNDSELSALSLLKPSFMINYIGISLAIVLIGIIAKQNGLSNLEWGLFGLIAISTIVIAYFDEKLYGFLPWLSMLTNISILYGCKPQDNLSFALILAAFSSIYVISAYFIIFKSKMPLFWAGIAGAGALLFYFTGYFKLNKTEILLDWSLIAAIIGFLAIFAISQVRKLLLDHKFVQHIYAIFAVVATTAISTAIFIKIDQEFFPIILAVEILAISWISTKTYINCLRKIAKALFYIFIAAISKQLVFVVQEILNSLINLELVSPKRLLFFERPIFHLGIPAIALLASSYFLRKKKDDALVKLFEISSTALFSTMLYYLIYNIFLETQIHNSFLERGIFTNALFVWGLLCLYISKKFNRDSFCLSGAVICMIAIFRIVYFDMIFQNPIWSNQKIAGIIFFNSLLLTYGLPVLYAHLAKNKLTELKKENFASYLNVFIMSSAFILINLNVRHIFHGQYLAQGYTTEVETYTYSAVWLATSLALLFIGAIKANQSLRYTSLVLLLLTIGKVFLYDASSLEGLYRVFSFLGLGLSLVAIGYFYAKFIFKANKE
jgi:uncharacterized membrane protein